MSYSNSRNTGNSTCTAITPGTTFSVTSIQTPGCYACNWNGWLLRVTDECFDADGTTTFTFSGNGNCNVTFLCDDPTTSTNECRSIGNSYGITCNF